MARVRTIRHPTKLDPPIALGNHRIELSPTNVVVLQTPGNDKLLIELTPIEALLFKLLVTKPDTLLTEKTLLCSLRDHKGNHQAPQGIDRHINGLRTKLHGSGLSIHRVVAIGWLLTDEAE